MTNVDIIRAWKDESYRAGLSETQRAALPANPAGVVDATDAEMDNLDGGTINWIPTFYCPSVAVCPTKSRLCEIVSKTETIYPNCSR
jgi:mersacidin/lichenicidin family type 2 lantibiotic